MVLFERIHRSLKQKIVSIFGFCTLKLKCDFSKGGDVYGELQQFEL